MRDLNELNSEFRVVVQVCSTLRIATWEHIFFGCLYAMLAFKQERNLLNRLPLEILLYISGQRQIKIALEVFGLRNGENCIIILGNNETSMKQAQVKCEKLLGGERSDEVLDIMDISKRTEICNYFQINPEELNVISQSDTEEAQKVAILKSILNRMALVVLEK